MTTFVEKGKCLSRQKKLLVILVSQGSPQNVFLNLTGKSSLLRIITLLARVDEYLEF